MLERTRSAEEEAIPRDRRIEGHGGALRVVRICLHVPEMASRYHAASARVIAARHLRDVQTYPQDPQRARIPLDPAVARDRLFFG